MTDFRNTPKWFYGMTKFDPVTEETRAVGATFDAVVHIGMPLKSVVKCIEYVEGEVFTLDSVKGVKNTTRWTFRAEPAGGCVITGDFEYKLGGGPIGKASAKLVEPLVGGAIRHTEREIFKFLSEAG